jgi:hypothetical protein
VLTAYLLVLTTWSIGSGIACSRIAKTKHRDVAAWAVAGFLFGVFAILVVGFSPADTSTTHKTCPTCAELIGISARVCPHCAHALPESTMHTPEAPVNISALALMGTAVKGGRIGTAVSSFGSALSGRR